MKKTILFFFAAILSFTAFSQTSKPAKPAIDTLTIDFAKVQYIKVGSTVVKAETLQEKGFWMPLSALQQLFEGLKKYPYENVYIAIDYLKQFFAIK